jgi:hypothetical protein
MDFISEIMPVLWHVLSKHKKGAINVSAVDENLTVNILLGRKRKSFTNNNPNLLLCDITQFASSM